MALTQNSKHTLTSGREMEVVATDLPGAYPVLGLIRAEGRTVRYTNDGRADTSSGGADDVRPVAPARLTGYINLYSSHVRDGNVKLPKSGEKLIYATAEQAKAAVTGNKGTYIGTAKVELDVTPNL